MDIRSIIMASCFATISVFLFIHGVFFIVSNKGDIFYTVVGFVTLLCLPFTIKLTDTYLGKLREEVEK